jgi:hypothetical protein
MAQPQLIINLGAGGLGRPLASKDHISGILSYQANANLPAGFGTDTTKKVFAITEAEDLGIVEGSADFGLTWYHVREFFRIQPKGELFISFVDASALNFATHDFAEVSEMQLEAEGTMRQLGVIQMQAAFASANVTALHAQAAAVRSDAQPLSIIFAPDTSGTADLSTLTDLRGLAASLVSVVIGEDGGATGAALAVTEGTSVTTLGATLGAVSLANVNESIAWVQKFNLSNGSELETAAFANGDLVKLKTTPFLDALNDKGYIFLRKFTKEGLAGTYHNDSPTAVSETSDYAYIENNRVIDKASRNIRTFVLPQLNSPLVVNSDGTLFEDTVTVFQSLTERGLESMEKDQEISAFAVTIDPTQNVLSTSTLKVSVKIVPVGVARNIEFTIGYALNV